MLMLALITLNSSNFLWPSAIKISQHKLAKRDCIVLRIVLGNQKAGGSWKDGKELRPLGIGIDLAKTVKGGDDESS